MSESAIARSPASKAIAPLTQTHDRKMAAKRNRPQQPSPDRPLPNKISAIAERCVGQSGSILIRSQILPGDRDPKACQEAARRNDK